MKDIILKIIAIVVLGIGMFVIGLFIGCKSLKVYQLEGQPQECNDFYTTADMSLKGGSDFLTLMTLQWNKCIDARKTIKEKECEKWIFQGEKLNKEEYKKYGYYLECIK